MQCASPSSTNFVSLAQGCQIHVTLAAHHANYHLYSTSHVMVGFAFSTSVVAVGANISLELSIAPQLNSKLVPAHARAAIASRGIDLDNFTPLSKDEMLARLD